MKQSKVEETKVEKTENGQVTAQTEEVKETRLPSKYYENSDVFKFPNTSQIAHISRKA